MNSQRRTIPVTCTTHSGGTNFCNLLMTKETDGTIVFDPHVAHCCVLRLDERAATAVFGTLGEWLGWPARTGRARRDTCGWCSTAGYATLRSWHTTQR